MSIIITEMKHEINEVKTRRLRQKTADAVSSAAVWAILCEAAVTPKPGLVDRANSGSHSDMDFLTLINSALALLPWFRDCALSGFDSGSEGELKCGPAALFEALRPRGKKAEVQMKKASGGVNTHRGYIFSLGILCAALGRLCGRKEKPDLEGLISFSKSMVINIVNDFSGSHEKKIVSHGETVYAQTGIQGIRGEVSRGFPSITEHALPLLTRLLKQGYSMNDAGVMVLLTLMAHAQDTNIIYRGGVDAFRSIQEELRAFLNPPPDMEAVMEKAAFMDREFILKNLSPGGCADLLGITFFLWRIFTAKFYKSDI